MQNIMLIIFYKQIIEYFGTSKSSTNQNQI